MLQPTYSRARIERLGLIPMFGPALGSLLIRAVSSMATASVTVGSFPGIDAAGVLGRLGA